MPGLVQRDHCELVTVEHIVVTWVAQTGNDRIDRVKTSLSNTGPTTLDRGDFKYQLVSGTVDANIVQAAEKVNLRLGSWNQHCCIHSVETSLDK